MCLLWHHRSHLLSPAHPRSSLPCMAMRGGTVKRFCQVWFMMIHDSYRPAVNTLVPCPAILFFFQYSSVIKSITRIFIAWQCMRPWRVFWNLLEGHVTYSSGNQRPCCAWSPSRSFLGAQQASESHLYNQNAAFPCRIASYHVTCMCKMIAPLDMIIDVFTPMNIQVILQCQDLEHLIQCARFCISVRDLWVLLNLISWKNAKCLVVKWHQWQDYPLQMQPGHGVRGLAVGGHPAKSFSRVCNDIISLQPTSLELWRRRVEATLLVKTGTA